MVLKVYGDRMSQPSRAVIIFCKINGIDFEEIRVDIFKNQHYSPEYKGLFATICIDFLLNCSNFFILLCLGFAASKRVNGEGSLFRLPGGSRTIGSDVRGLTEINPMNQIPAIVDGELKLFESHAILIYLASAYSQVASHWYPTDVYKRAKIHSILDWHHSFLRRGAAGLVFNALLAPLNGISSYPQVIIQAEEILLRSLSKLENFWLKDGPFLAGNSQPSIADLLLACEIMQLELFSEKDRDRILSPYKKILQWVEDAKSATAPHFDEVHGLLFKSQKRYHRQMSTKSRKNQARSKM